MKKSLVCGLSMMILFGGVCFADNITNIYYINSSAGQNYGNILCTTNGSICSNGFATLSRSQVRYVPAKWKRPTIREKKLSKI